MAHVTIRHVCLRVCECLCDLFVFVCVYLWVCLCVYEHVYLCVSVCVFVGV